MCSDKKVRQRGALFAFVLSVVEKRFASKKKGLLRNVQHLQSAFRQRCLQLLDLFKANGNFGIDDWIDE